jgi:hypothetical protein
MKVKLSKLVLIFLLCSLFLQPTVSACRYNVRDIGFIDVGIEPYYLYGYINNSIPQNITVGLTQILRAELAETNIKTEVVNVDQSSGHPAVKYFDAELKTFPAAILISPEGETLQVPLPKPDENFNQNLLEEIEKVVTSTVRLKVLEKNLDVFAVILLIEGSDDSQNKIVYENAADAITRITDQMKLMPKKVENPPELVILKKQDLSREKILLWALGLEPESIKEPHAAVYYGKVRRMGPVLKGAEITAERLMNFLAVVGADCECGLDRSWMLGPTLPFRWDRSAQSDLVKSLGFDPENPMVKMEVSQILRSSIRQLQDSRDIDAFAGQSLGYQEIIVQFDLPPHQDTSTESRLSESSEPAAKEILTQTDPKNPDTVQQIQPSPQPQVQTSPSEPELPTARNIRSTPLHLIVFIAIFVVVIGLFIVVRGR